MHSLSRLCTSIHPLRLLSAFIPSVHHVHLDPSIALLYLLHYSMADPLNSLSTFRAKPPIVHVGHYGCHGSAGTPLGTHANGEDSGLEESRKAIRT
jgi:hypothetical protein